MATVAIVGCGTMGPVNDFLVMPTLSRTALPIDQNYERVILELLRLASLLEAEQGLLTRWPDL